MNQHIDDALKTHGMARSQFQVLYFIDLSGTLTQKALLKKMNIEPATLTKLVDTLSAKGYVKRSASVTDKRSKILALTELGKTTIAEVPHPGMLVETTMFNGLTSTDKKSFELLVNKIIKNLESA